MEKNIYPLLCFLTLISRGQIDQAPIYLAEKVHMLNVGYEAFGYLDVHNMRKVLDYCTRWHVEIPAVWQKEYDGQVQAGKELGLI